MPDVNGIPVVEFSLASEIYKPYNTTDLNDLVPVEGAGGEIPESRLRAFARGGYGFIPLWMFSYLTNNAASGYFTGKDTLIPARVYNVNPMYIENTTSSTTKEVLYDVIIDYDRLQIGIPLKALDMLADNKNYVLNISVSFIGAYVNPSGATTEQLQTEVSFTVTQG